MTHLPIRNFSSDILSSFKVAVRQSKIKYFKPLFEFKH